MKSLLSKEWMHYGVAEVKTTWSPKQIAVSERKKVTDSRKVYEYVIPFWEDITYLESFYIVHLDRSNRIIGHSFISKGGTSGTVVDPKVVFQNSLGANASGIVLVHNHPSGSLNPSEQDKVLTKRLKSCGQLLGVLVLDHLIISSEEYLSFADTGLM